MQRLRPFVSTALAAIAAVAVAAPLCAQAAGAAPGGTQSRDAGGQNPGDQDPDNGGAAATGQPGPAAIQFTKEFGPPDVTGSFRVRFDAQGASVVWLQLMDHYVDVVAKKKAEHDPARDYQLLVWAGSDFSFWIADRSALFGQNLSKDTWEYEVQDDAVRFWIDSGRGLRLVKTYRHRPAQRGLAIELSLENTGAATAGGTFQFELGGPALVSPAALTLFSNPGVAIAVAEGGEPQVVHPQLGLSQELVALGGQTLSMAGSTNRFFGGFLFPLDDAARTAASAVRMTSLPATDGEFGTKAGSSARVILSAAMPIPARDLTSTVTWGCYLGPKSFRVFDESPEHARFLPIMDVDLEPPCCGVSVPGGRFMAATLLKLLGWFEGIVGNWGVAIMMLTILVRGCLSPLNFRMQKSMRAFGAKMAVLKPKLDEIKQKYGHDPKAQQQAMIEFQREHKMIPPIGGCLPIFLTMPIYIGLFTALRTAYDLRHEGFMLWIDDLSRPDALVNLGIPVVQNLNLLPLLWIALLLTLQMRMPLPTDPQQRQVQQIMRYMPVIFGVLLYNYASGLMVYMVTSMLWTFVESAMIKKVLGPMDPNAGAVMPTPVM